MMEYLFIGGSQNGRRLVVDSDSRSVRIPVVDPNGEILEDLTGKTFQAYGEEVYRRFVLPGSTQLFYVMADVELSGDAIMTLLIENYKPGEYNADSDKP